MIESVAESYFSSINPIAARIKADIDEISSNYEHLWYEFKPHEKNEVINEQLMKSDLILKYMESMPATKSKSKSPDGTPVKSCLYDGRNLSTFAKIKTGLKKNHDDVSGISVRDEHSAPFSMKTRSQINLNIFGSYDHHDVADGVEKKHQVGKMKQPPPPPPTSINKRNSSTTETEALSSIQPINVAFGDSCNLSNKNFLSKLMNFNGSTGQESEYQFVSSMEPSNSLTSEEDNNVEEFSTLLKASELKKTYDFLQNW